MGGCKSPAPASDFCSKGEILPLPPGWGSLSAARRDRGGGTHVWLGGTAQRGACSRVRRLTGGFTLHRSPKAAVGGGSAWQACNTQGSPFSTRPLPVRPAACPAAQKRPHRFHPPRASAPSAQCRGGSIGAKGPLGRPARGGSHVVRVSQAGTQPRTKLSGQSQLRAPDLTPPFPRHTGANTRTGLAQSPPTVAEPTCLQTPTRPPNRSQCHQADPGGPTQRSDVGGPREPTTTYSSCRKLCLQPVPRPQ